MTIDINWTDLLETLPDEPSSRELIPADTYVVKVDKAEANIAKSGNAKIDLTFVVDEGKYKGKKVWGRINFATNSPQSMAITVEQLGQFGITRQWLSQNSPTTEQIARKLTGETIKIKVAHREYEGTMYYDVKGYTAVKTQDPF